MCKMPPPVVLGGGGDVVSKAATVASKHSISLEHGGKRDMKPHVCSTSLHQPRLMLFTRISWPVKEQKQDSRGRHTGHGQQHDPDHSGHRGLDPCSHQYDLHLLVRRQEVTRVLESPA